MMADVLNAFVQTGILKTKDGEDRIIMKIIGVLVNCLVEIAPEVYGKYVVFQNGKKVLYVQVLKALYSMLIALMLWYKNFTVIWNKLVLSLIHMTHVWQIAKCMGNNIQFASMWMTLCQVIFKRK